MYRNKEFPVSSELFVDLEALFRPTIEFTAPKGSDDADGCDTSLNHPFMFAYLLRDSTSSCLVVIGLHNARYSSEEEWKSISAVVPHSNTSHRHNCHKCVQAKVTKIG